MVSESQFSESIIPSFVWGFVKKIVKNPITAGILAIIVWQFIKNKKLKVKKESLTEMSDEDWEEILELLDGELRFKDSDNDMANSGDMLATKIPKKKKEITEPADEKDVDVKELAMGIKVEMEHTDSKEEAKKIALQHLAENPKYYSKLLKYVEPKEFFEALKLMREAQNKLNLWTVTLECPSGKQIKQDVQAKDENQAKRLAKNQADKKYNKQHQVIKVKKEFFEALEEMREAHITYTIKLYNHRTMGNRTINYSGTLSHVKGQAVKYSQDCKDLEIIKNNSVLFDKKSLSESITIDISVGDTILGGKFKNKKVIVKDIGVNDRNEPTINGRNLMQYRLVPKEIEESLEESNINGWKDIGGNLKDNKVSRWYKDNNTAYITRKQWEDKTDYAFGVNNIVYKNSWSDDIKEVQKYATKYMDKN